MEKKSSRVCVTGGASYIGSWLVKKLLEKGHYVHATLRNLGDHSKTSLLRSLPGAETRLSLFQADIYSSEDFEQAIQGCEFVFLVATPYQHNPNISNYKDTTEAAIASIRTIMHLCEKSGTVRRVIYTGSVTAASPLKEDGTGYKECIDESIWTLLHLSYAHCEDHEKGYTLSKTLSEKEILGYNYAYEKRKIEVVSLACGLVGGETLLPYVPVSVQIIVSPLTGAEICNRQLKFLQALLGSVPLVHIEDVCEAHVFCMEKPSMTGRFICANQNPAMKEFIDHYEQKYPDLVMIKEVVENEKTIECCSTKLVDMGFKYAYNAKQIFDASVECAVRLGGLKKLSRDVTLMEFQG